MCTGLRLIDEGKSNSLLFTSDDDGGGMEGEHDEQVVELGVCVGRSGRSCRRRTTNILQVQDD